MPSKPLDRARTTARRWPTARWRAFAAAALWLLVTSACGRKEPPLPPPSLVPAAPAELTVEQRGEEVVLSFLFPTTTIGGLPLETFEAVEISELVRAVPDGFFDDPEEDDEEKSGETESDESGEEGDEEGDSEADDRDDDKDSAENDVTDEEGAEEDDAEDSVGKRKKKRKKVFTVDRREFLSAAQVRLRLEGAELASATRGNRISTRFRLQKPETAEEGDEITSELVAHIFGVKIVREEEKLVSPYSKFFTLIPKTAPPAPTDLSIEATADGIVVKWASDTVAAPKGDDEDRDADDAAEDASETEVAAVEPEPEVPEEHQIVGFHVYRRLAQEPGFESPLQEVDPGKRRFVDKTAPYDSRYVYAVTAIRELDPVIESAIIEEREVDYRDRFPPPVPRNVAALAESGRVRLLWTPRPAADLAGYLVYRSNAGAEYQLVTATPTLDSEYIDTDVRSGDRLSYYVVSIDKAGNRSDQSKQTETTVP